MKILYAIQGTGNGHLTAALEVLPHLLKRGQVDILISGTEVDVPLPYEVRYRFHGLCFVFGKKGGIDYVETYRKAKLKRLFQEVNSLPVEEYDLVFSDFEPVSAWACYLKGLPCIGFSHQAAVINKNSPRPRKADVIGQAVLRHYAPTSVKYGFHFIPYDGNIHTPIIRREIREAIPHTGSHYTVYLPAFSEKRIAKLLAKFPKVEWHVFSKRRTESVVYGNIVFHPVSNRAFVESLLQAKGVLCGAGFQTPSETIFLHKKLLVIPMKGQYEQQCNAAALKLLGVPVLKNLKSGQYAKLKAWIDGDSAVNMDYPDETEWVLSDIIEQQTANGQRRRPPERSLATAARFRRFILKKIFNQLGS